MTIDRIRVMISSRCNDYETAKGERFPVSQLREQLASDIKGLSLFGQRMFDCWLNTEEPDKLVTRDLWDECLVEVRRAHVVLALVNGHAGWGSERGRMGICHAELQAALFSGRDRTVIVRLPPDRAAGEDDHAAFNGLLDREQAFSAPPRDTVEDARQRSLGALAEAVIRLSRQGAAGLRRDSYALGEALDWSRYDYHRRKQVMEEACIDSLRREKGAAAAVRAGSAVAVAIGAAKVLLCVHAIPAAMSVAAARELVGRPFLADHQRIAEGDDAVGPVHLILCQKTATEKQATDLLGFPDATVVATSFGVYLADPVQKIQIVLLANCRDAGSTGFAVQRLFDWLERSGERDALVRRAVSRQRIVSMIRQEIGDPAAPPAAAGAATRRAGSPTRRRSPRRGAA